MKCGALPRSRPDARPEGATRQGNRGNFFYFGPPLAGKNTRTDSDLLKSNLMPDSAFFPFLDFLRVIRIRRGKQFAATFIRCARPRLTPAARRKTETTSATSANEWRPVMKITK